MRKIELDIEGTETREYTCRDEVLYAALTTESDKQDSLGTFY